MAISPNYSWPLPDDTDLVKNGAEAIRDLGNAIDTTVDSLPSGGLVHIKTETFSGAAAVSVNNVFSSTFNNYKVLITDLTSATESVISLRGRTNIDETTTNYSFQIIEASGAVVGSSRSTAQTSFRVGVVRTSGASYIEFDLLSPNKALTTGFSSNVIDPVSAGRFESLVGLLATNTQYTGFTFFSAANIAGTFSVYGYSKG